RKAPLVRTVGREERGRAHTAPGEQRERVQSVTAVVARAHERDDVRTAQPAATLAEHLHAPARERGRGTLHEAPREARLTREERLLGGTHLLGGEGVDHGAHCALPRGPRAGTLVQVTLRA